MGILNKLQSPDPSQADPIYSRPCTTLGQLMEKKLLTRDKKDRIFFDHSVKGLSALCIVGTLYMNTMIRRSVMVFEHWIVTTVGISTFTSVSNYAAQYGLVQWPLLEGKLQCTTCTVLRGAVIQGVTACVLPGVVSFLLAAIAADSFKSAKIPELTFPVTQEFRTFWGKISSGIQRRSKYMLVFQMLAGGFIAYREKQVAEELFSSISREEKDVIWKDVLRKMDNQF